MEHMFRNMRVTGEAMTGRASILERVWNGGGERATGEAVLGSSCCSWFRSKQDGQQALTMKGWVQVHSGFSFSPHSLGFRLTNAVQLTCKLTLPKLSPFFPPKTMEDNKGRILLIAFEP